MSSLSKVRAFELGGGLLGPAVQGPEFHYDEMLAAAEAERDAPPTDHPIGQIQAGIAEAFAGPDAQTPVLETPVLETPVLETPVFETAVFETRGEGVAARISIHVFCELPESATRAEAALKDRRLARAAGSVFTGGFTAALARYKVQPTPSLLIVEALDGSVLLSELDRLAEVCDPSTKVMVVGRDNDIALYRALIKKGVSEYLVGPVDPLALIGAISTLYQDPQTPFVGRSIAVIGSKGGVGASILAHNLAWALGEKAEASTVLVDLDLPFGSGGLNFNQDPAQGVANGLADPERLDPVLLERMMVRCTDRLSLFAAPATLDDDYDIPADTYVEVLQKVRAASPFVVLDMPHLWSGWVRRTLLTADEAVVVATPDLASLRNAKNLIELLVQGRPNDGPPRLVLNQVGAPHRPEISVKDFAEAVGCQPALVIGFDAKLFGHAANNGQMIEELSPKSKAAEGLAGLARAIARRDSTISAAPTAKGSLLSALFKRKA